MVADVNATSSERTLNPPDPRVKREPLLRIRERLAQKVLIHPCINIQRKSLHRLHGLVLKARRPGCLFPVIELRVCWAVPNILLNLNNASTFFGFYTRRSFRRNIRFPFYIQHMVAFQLIPPSVQHAKTPGGCPKISRCCRQLSVAWSSMAGVCTADGKKSIKSPSQTCNSCQVKWYVQLQIQSAGW